MFYLEKSPDKDFMILNLTDPQLGLSEWAQDQKHRAILVYTVQQLMEKVKPDLVTITGDISWALDLEAYELFAELMEQYGVPWAPVMGNHDHRGPGITEAILEVYLKKPHCLFEKGDPAMGKGNYVIAVCENGKPVEGLFMMDSHSMIREKNSAGEEVSVWAKLQPNQIEWYKQNVLSLQAQGCTSTSMFLHIPINAYKKAWAAAFNSELSVKTLSVADSYAENTWNPGYKDSFGLIYEGICSYPNDDGVFDVIQELKSTKHIVAGHDHTNNAVIRYEGVRLIYGLKTGSGCYWKPELNGGTVLRVGSSGIEEVWHEYVDVSSIC